MRVHHKIRNEFAYSLEYITNGLPVYLFIRQIAKILALLLQFFLFVYIFLNEREILSIFIDRKDRKILEFFKHVGFCLLDRHK